MEDITFRIVSLETMIRQALDIAETSSGDERERCISLLDEMFEERERLLEEKALLSSLEAKIWGGSDIPIKMMQLISTATEAVRRRDVGGLNEVITEISSLLGIELSLFEESLDARNVFCVLSGCQQPIREGNIESVITTLRSLTTN